jgi:hypothetical protein
MKTKHRSDKRKQSGGSAPAAARRREPDREVRFYAEAVYAINRGLPHIVDFPGRLS